MWGNVARGNRKLETYLDFDSNDGYVGGDSNTCMFDLFFHKKTVCCLAGLF